MENAKISTVNLLKFVPDFIKCVPCNSVKHSYDIKKLTTQQGSNNIAQDPYISYLISEFFASDVINDVKTILHNSGNFQLEGDFQEKLNQAINVFNKINPQYSNQQKYLVVSCGITKHYQYINEMIDNSKCISTFYPIGVIDNVIVYIDAYMTFNDDSKYLFSGDFNLQYEELTNVKKSTKYADDEGNPCRKNKKGAKQSDIYSGKIKANLDIKNFKCIRYD